MSEQALEKKIQRHHSGNASFSQLEFMHCVTAKPLVLRKRPRKHICSASTAGDCIGPLGVPDLRDEWLLTFEQKKAYYGSARVAVGGVTVEGADEVDKHALEVARKKRADGAIEPMCFHTMLPEFYEEILHAYQPRAVVDWTCTDGRFAAVCTEAGVPYVGWTLTDKHCEAVTRRVAHMVFQKMTSEQSPLYDAVCAKLMKPTVTVPKSVKHPKAPKAKANRKGKAKSSGLTGDDDDQPEETAAGPAAADDEAEAADTAAAGDSRAADGARDVRARLLSRLAEIAAA